MSDYKLYNSWTIEEANSEGRRFKGKCKANYGYEGYLTQGKIYELETAGMGVSTPFCNFIDDTGREGCAHLTRFEKVEE